jgi:hypothetical protein
MFGVAWRADIPGSCWNDCVGWADVCVEVELGRDIGSSMVGIGAGAVEAGLSIVSPTIEGGDGTGTGAAAAIGPGSDSTLTSSILLRFDR